MYTVKQLATLANVSVRTLHHYDAIGLLHPSQVGANGYRQYDEAALLRLQQILLYRELDIELAQIKVILDQPDFDLVAALRAHKAALAAKGERLRVLMQTIDDTIQHVTGETPNRMSEKRLFNGFDAETQKEYEREVRLEYGPTLVNESIRRWNSYTKEEQQAIMEEGRQGYSDLVAAMEKGLTGRDAEVIALLDRWQDHIRIFYEPTLEILRGLGELYNTDERFMATFRAFDADLPAYLQEIITVYVDDLETAEIERMLAADAALRAK